MMQTSHGLRHGALLLAFLLLLVLFGDAERHTGDKTNRSAEILRGLPRLDLPAAFLRVLAVIVESGSHTQRRAYPSRRRMAIA